MHWVLEALSLGLKQQWLEAYHSYPSSVKVKNGVAIPSLPPMSSCHAASVTKHRNNFAFMKLSDVYMLDEATLVLPCPVFRYPLFIRSIFMNNI
jgi:hypothetical protein